jgi:hypothetical protein
VIEVKKELGLLPNGSALWSAKIEDVKPKPILAIAAYNQDIINARRGKVKEDLNTDNLTALYFFGPPIDLNLPRKKDKNKELFPKDYQFFLRHEEPGASAPHYFHFAHNSSAPLDTVVQQLRVAQTDTFKRALGGLKMKDKRFNTYCQIHSEIITRVLRRSLIIRSRKVGRIS